MMQCYHVLGRQVPKWAVPYCVISKEKVSIASIKNRHFLAARDKWRSLQMLLEQGIAVPSSVLSGCEVEPKQAIKQTTAPMIIKTLKGSQGIGVILAEHSQSAVSILENVKRCECPCLVTRFCRRGKRDRYSLFCDR